MSELHLACAARGSYVEHSAAMLHSALVNSGPLDLRIHFLCDRGLDAGLRAPLTEMVEAHGGSIEFLEISAEAVADLPTDRQFTAAMWYRILLPELLPSVATVLYLDVDTLVLDSLVPLSETDLSDSYLAAVSNVFQANHIHRPKNLGMPPSQVYFNSGVLLMNLDLMRRDAATAQLRECARSRGDDLEWPDQDALNLVLGARRLPLHPRWNRMNSLDFPSSAEVYGSAAVREARERPAIRHFEGPALNKPWHYLSAPEDSEHYRRHRSRTPWPDFTPEGRTMGNRIRRWRTARRRPTATA
jgi:lipopolysaccharide biosynthesis glycosyltransferase